MTFNLNSFDNANHRAYRSAADLERAGYLAELTQSYADAPGMTWAGFDSKTDIVSPGYALFNLG